MNVPEQEIRSIHTKLDTALDRMERLDQRAEALERRMANVESWSRIPDNYDGASVHEKRDIGIVIRAEMREVLQDTFSPKKIVGALIVMGSLVNIIAQLWTYAARIMGLES